MDVIIVYKWFYYTVIGYTEIPPKANKIGNRKHWFGHAKKSISEIKIGVMP